MKTAIVVRITNTGAIVRSITEQRAALGNAMSMAGIVWLADPTQFVTVIGPDGETRRVWCGFKKDAA